MEDCGVFDENDKRHVEALMKMAELAKLKTLVVVFAGNLPSCGDHFVIATDAPAMTDFFSRPAGAED